MLDADRNQPSATRSASPGARHEHRPNGGDLDPAEEHHHVAGEHGQHRSDHADQQRAHLARLPFPVKEEEQAGGRRGEPERRAGQVEPEKIGDPGDGRPQRGLDSSGAVEKGRFNGEQRDRAGETDPGDDARDARLPRCKREDDDGCRDQRRGYERQLEPTAQHGDATSRYGPAPALRPRWRSTGRLPSPGGGCDRSRYSAGRTASCNTDRG